MLRRVLLSVMIALSMVIGMLGVAILDSEDMIPGAFLCLLGFSMTYGLIMIDEANDF